MNLKKELLEFVANIDDWTNIHEHAEEIVNDYLEETGKNLMLYSSYTMFTEKEKELLVSLLTVNIAETSNWVMDKKDINEFVISRKKLIKKIVSCK